VTLLSVPAPEAGTTVHVTPICEESFCNRRREHLGAAAGTVAESGATDTVIGAGGCA